MTSHKIINPNKIYSIETLCYFAGILDGDGCIRIGKYKNAKQELRYRSFIQVGMVNEDIMIWLKENIGGNYYTCKPTKHFHKIHWEWQINMKEGEIVLKQCIPYMIVRRKQAELYLEFAKTMYRSGYDLRQDKKLLEEVLEKRKIIFYKNKELNKKGVDKNEISKNPIII